MWIFGFEEVNKLHLSKYARFLRDTHATLTAFNYLILLLLVVRNSQCIHILGWRHMSHVITLIICLKDTENLSLGMFYGLFPKKTTKMGEVRLSHTGYVYMDLSIPVTICRFKYPDYIQTSVTRITPPPSSRCWEIWFWFRKRAERCGTPHPGYRHNLEDINKNKKQWQQREPRTFIQRKKSFVFLL